MTGVLITGAAQGLGKTLAQNIFKAGYSVALTDINLDMVTQTCPGNIAQWRWGYVRYP